MEKMLKCVVVNAFPPFPSPLPHPAVVFQKITKRKHDSYINTSEAFYTICINVYFL